MIGLVIIAISTGVSIAVIQHLIEMKEINKLEVEIERNKKIFRDFNESRIEKLAATLKNSSNHRF